MATVLDFVRGLSLRYKLLALVIVPLLLLTGTVIYLTAQWTTKYTYEQLFAKVNTDLRVTREIFSRIELDKQRQLTALSSSAVLQSYMQNDAYADVLALLDQQQQTSGFDFVNFLNANGTQRLGADGWTAWPLNRSPITDQVFSYDESRVNDLDTASGIEIYPRSEWERVDPSLAEKAVYRLIDTPRAAPTDKTTEDRAMVIRVLQRVYSSAGNLLGVLEGGLLINRNYAFVDEIRDLVYGPGSLAEGSRGTVTVFMDDVRITTNVPSNDDTRALGTRVSVEVRNTVLGEGTPWIDRAFVVNDWYISAYEPIIDVNGNRVGMLYAGYLEAPFRSDLNRGIVLSAAVVLAGTLFAVLVATVGAKSIFKPMESIASVVRATAAGERRRIGDLKVHDEIGELATQFDLMLDKLEEHSAQISANAHELEHKVQERTTELRQKNTSLQESITMLHEAQQKLATAERLAAVGELTAGVAHEINNPTAVILGNLEVLIQEIGEKRELVKTETDLIFEQVARIRSITDRLLQYSRPNSTSPHAMQSTDGILPDAVDASVSAWSISEASPEVVEEVLVNDVIESSLVLVKHELVKKQLYPYTDYQYVPPIQIDQQELQQVIVNLIMNAVHAVDPHGEIEISTQLIQDESVCILVKDNGVGIAPENIKRLFDPFFTHGKKSGTGLGLAVSYGIVQRYNGNIEVESVPGKGSVFRIVLPIHRAVDHATDEQQPNNKSSKSTESLSLL